MHLLHDFRGAVNRQAHDGAQQLTPCGQEAKKEKQKQGQGPDSVKDLPLAKCHLLAARTSSQNNTTSQRSTVQNMIQFRHLIFKP